MKIMCKFLRPVKSICCILLSLLVAFLIVSQTVFASEEKVVRVGYDSNSQFIKESDGHYYVNILKKSLNTPVGSINMSKMIVGTIRLKNCAMAVSI